MESPHGDLADLFGLLSDETRLQIVMLLSEGPRNVSSLCNSLKLPQPTISHHLALLRRADVITNRHEGKQVFYSLNGHAEDIDHRGLRISTSGFTIRAEPH